LGADGVFDVLEVCPDVSDVGSAFFFQFEGVVGKLLDFVFDGSSRPFPVGFLDPAADIIGVLDDVVPVPGTRPVRFATSDTPPINVEVGEEG
jgi:hypothetical protein